MNDKSTTADENLDAYEAEIMAQDRRWKSILWVAAVLFFAAVAIAFTTTLNQLGSMNAHISGVFEVDETDVENATASPEIAKSEVPKIEGSEESESSE